LNRQEEDRLIKLNDEKKKKEADKEIKRRKQENKLKPVSMSELIKVYDENIIKEIDEAEKQVLDSDREIIYKLLSTGSDEEKKK